MPETYGVPVEEIQRGIQHGVRKINVDTDNRLAITGAIRKVCREAGRVRPARLPEAGPRRDGEVVRERMIAFGQAGQAGKVPVVSLDEMARRYGGR